MVKLPFKSFFQGQDLSLEVYRINEKMCENTGHNTANHTPEKITIIIVHEI